MARKKAWASDGPLALFPATSVAGLGGGRGQSRVAGVCGLGGAGFPRHIRAGLGGGVDGGGGVEG